MACIDDIIYCWF